MTNASSTFRALVIYALVLPVALVVGYMVAVPADLFSMGTVGLVLAVLITPLCAHSARLLLGSRLPGARG